MSNSELHTDILHLQSIPNEESTRRCHRLAYVANLFNLNLNYHDYTTLDEEESLLLFTTKQARPHEEKGTGSDGAERSLKTLQQ